MTVRNFTKTMRIDFVIPVFNEESCLAANIERLDAHLQTHASYDWKIIIADNASTDQTPVIADNLESKNDNVENYRLERKGRGFALRSTFEKSRADVVAYMDVDLATDLDHIADLVSGIENGYDIVIGSRLLPSSLISRSLKREVISRSYVSIVRLFFGNICSDYQCGFKAFRTGTIKMLLANVEDNNWFFDTEILLIASNLGYRILDIPVKWTEGPSSTVKIFSTAIEDLRGLWRVRRNLRLRLAK